MSRINLSGMIFILVVFVAVGCSATQEKPHPLWDKTVTLPNGEVVLDISGEWDLLGEFYGIFGGAEPLKDIPKFTQEEATFLGVKQIASQYKPAGSEMFKGELDINGFKEIYVYIASSAMDYTFVWEKCKWEIINSGNAINLDCGKRATYSLTRK